MFRSIAPTLLVLGLALPLGSGCRSFQGNMLRREVAQAPSPQPDRPDPDAIVRAVALEHDRRAGLVRSLKVADLNIKIDSFQDQAGRDRSPFLGGTAGGVLVMERPKNLRVLLRKPMGMSVADIGSNDREFWFANDMANEMVVGHYARTEGFADPMLASVRPDWIFEVLGLEPLAVDAEIKPGGSDATLTLVEARRLSNGVSMVKESDVNVAERRIVEHRLYTEGRRTLVARARVEQPQRIKVGQGTGAEPPPTIELPGTVRLTIPEVAELTMYLRGIELNPAIDFVQMTSFDRPEKAGYAVVDVLELAGHQGVALAEATPAPPPIPGPARPSREQAPGALMVPRSDRSVARTEDLTSAPRGTDPRFRPISGASPIALDLPSPGRAPSPEVRRESWDLNGNRFPRAALARD